MKLKHFFLALAILGMCYTWYFNIQYFMNDENASLLNFFKIAEATLPGKSYGADLLVVVLTFFVFMIPESIKLKIKYWWVLIPLTFLIAVAFTFPLFLYMREHAIEKKMNEI